MDLAVTRSRYSCLSAVYASMAGSLYAHNVSAPSALRPLASWLSVMIVTMAVVGGLASIWGALFGTAVVRHTQQQVLLRLAAGTSLSTA